MSKISVHIIAFLKIPSIYLSRYSNNNNNNKNNKTNMQTNTYIETHTHIYTRTHTHTHTHTHAHTPRNRYIPSIWYILIINIHLLIVHHFMLDPVVLELRYRCLPITVVDIIRVRCKNIYYFYVKTLDFVVYLPNDLSLSAKEKYDLRKSFHVNIKLFAADTLFPLLILKFVCSLA